jgi:hypothetical protein
MELSHDFSEFIGYFVAREVRFLVVGGYAMAAGSSSTARGVITSISRSAG